MLQTLISPLTQNAKLGQGVATTYRPVGDSAKDNGTCPSICPHLPENGGKCYTRKFLVNRQQNLSRQRNDTLDRLLLKNAKLVRLHTSGDFFKKDGDMYSLDKEYLDTIIAWCVEHPDVTVWTYTHDVSKLIEEGCTYSGNYFPENLHIVASIESDDEHNYAKEHGFRTAQVIDQFSEKKEHQTLCPYDLNLNMKRLNNVTCASCTLCFNPKHKKDIAFLKH